MSWYLVHTKPSGEVVAQANLERQAYEVYFPRLKQTARYRGGWRERVGALFPGYIFLRLDEGRQALDPVRSTLGVAAVVRFGARYSVVPDAVITDLRKRADPRTGLHMLNHRVSLSPGTPVRVLEGPFAGLECVFERAVGAERVLVLLNLLGRETRVHLSVDLITTSAA